MSNSDLISRKEAIETFSLVLKGCNPELDPIHIRVLSSAIRLLEDEPAVDAIPVGWIKALTNHSDMFTRGAAKWVLGCWKREQEAR